MKKKPNLHGKTVLIFGLTIGDDREFNTLAVMQQDELGTCIGTHDEEPIRLEHLGIDQFLKPNPRGTNYEIGGEVVTPDFTIRIPLGFLASHQCYSIDHGGKTYDISVDRNGIGTVTDNTAVSQVIRHENPNMVFEVMMGSESARQRYAAIVHEHTSEIETPPAITRRLWEMHDSMEDEATDEVRQLEKELDELAGPFIHDWINRGR